MARIINSKINTMKKILFLCLCVFNLIISQNTTQSDSINQLKEVVVTYKEIAGALNNSIEQIEDAVMNALFNTPPALSADIYNEGLYLTGGGSMLRGLDKRISRKTKLPVYVAEDPLRAVARGTGIALKNTESYSFLIQ